MRHFSAIQGMENSRQYRQVMNIAYYQPSGYRILGEIIFGRQ
jgi:hypothetical protein